MQEHTDNLFNLHIAVASHRANQLLRGLTVVSVIFMPLTFIADFYSMNFDAPEFHWRFGYAAIWLVIAVLLAGSFAGSADAAGCVDPERPSRRGTRTLRRIPVTT